MRITNTTQKASSYIQNAPLVEKKKSTTISIKLTGAEAEMLDSFLDSLNQVGYRQTKSNFIRQAIFRAIEDGNMPETGEWKNEPLTIGEAAKLFTVAPTTIRSAIERKRFTPFEFKKLENGEWIVTKGGMTRLFDRKTS